MGLLVEEVRSCFEKHSANRRAKCLYPGCLRVASFPGRLITNPLIRIDTSLWLGISANKPRYCGIFSKIMHTSCKPGIKLLR